jgi:glycosyltransferase involved in cell wall biosynthesis
MRIGMMADVYKPHISGVTIHIELVKKHLESAGHEVFLFTFENKNYLDYEENVIRTSGLSIDIPSMEAGISLNIRYDRYARDLLASMDIVHAHHPFISGILALRYCKPLGIPIVFTNHTRYDLYYQAYLPMLPENLGYNLMQVYFPFFFKSCDLVIAPSKGIRDILRELGVNADMEIVPNGIDLDFVRSRMGTFRKGDLGFEEDETVLVYVGRLGPEKNVAFLLRAFAKALDSYEKGRLLIVGDGLDRKRLEKQAKQLGIESIVKFTGIVPYEEVPGYLGIADAFVTASVTEVHPLTLIEGMAAGLPILGIKSPGIEDIIEGGETGYLVRDDFSEFTSKLLRLLSDHKARKDMGGRAYERAEKYSIKQTSKKLLAHYEDLVRRAKDEPTKGGRMDKLKERLHL